MQPKTEAEYQAEDDLRVLMEAAEIQADDKRMAAARKCAQNKYKAMENAGFVGRARVMGKGKKKGGNSDYDMSK